MKKSNSIHVHNEQAAEYDQQVREYKWFGPEVLFGLSFEYVSPHDRLLDFGIGTGLGSLPFAKVGLEVSGIDGSMEMLKICKSKDFTKDLKQFDIRNTPLPYSNGFFNHVISCGLFQFFGDLEPMVKEISRIIKPGGIFAFTIFAQIPEIEKKGVSHNLPGYSEKESDWDTMLFMHSNRYIEKLLQSCGFDILKELKFLVWSGHGGIDDLCYAYVTQSAPSKS